MDQEDASVMVWEESRRLLVRQESEVDLLRSRSVGLFAAASIVAGLFASRLPKELNDFQAAAVTGALVGFVLMGGLVLAIQVPRDFGFSRNLDDYVAEMGMGTPASVRDFSYNSSKDANGSRSRSKPTIKLLYRYLAGAVGLLGVQVVAWALAIV